MLVGLSAVCLGVAVGLLVWAAGLSVWSWLVPEPSPGYAAWSESVRQGDNASYWAGMSPKAVASSVCAVAVILVAALVIVRFKRVSRYWGWSVLAAAIALAYLLLADSGMRQFFDWMQRLPVTPKLPTAVSSWWLAVSGTVAAALAAPAAARSARGGLWLAGIGLVVAVVVAGAATMSALRAGDDSRFVDATTATQTAVPPSPDRLGQKAFTIRIADDNGPSRGRNWRVEPGGAGFVTYGKDGVTAYGPDGVERWHYRRSGPRYQTVADVAVFDQGSTVVVMLGGRPAMLIGLDAFTGQQLWWSTDGGVTKAFGYLDYNRRSPPYLVGTNKDASEWTRYDTRTGKLLWSIPAPSTECRGWYGGNPSLPGSAYRCVSGDKADIRFVDVDPSTGQIRWKTTLLAGLPYSGHDLNAIRPSISRAGRDGYVMGAYVESTSDVGTFVSTADRRVLDFHGQVLVYRTRDESADFLATGPAPADDFMLRGPDGQARCTFADYPMTDLLNARAVILGAEVVFAKRQLKVFNRSDCTATGTAPTADAEEIIAASGVVLAVRTEDSGTYVDGYR
ncbi:PQQ-binding-like beta-propeller repeat protein [Mycolicibacterium mucogenicum]|uniref:PQQ-binding-like beta-propeller repeat protein n=1 Tax=Mycolicibacterium mucogenicum DSM 44124 TaxID=1226753 RepID=A0A8E4R6F8_MYCMU|nr:PQQ-binding-like beta-propeller repeat protein [Mycolicibacterium mucogenicum]QPG68570.1 PQQ-binding-like beta-propeller repeat protein [Mycolicibacterium mucogenicum DSM 44124]